MTVVPAASVEELVRAHHPGCADVVAVDERRSEWATSRVIEDIDVLLADGAVVALIAKHVGPEGLLEEARRVKPAFVQNLDREVDVYRDLLGEAGLGTAAYYGETSLSGGGRVLILERVAGHQIHETDDIETWREAARWLALFHARFGESFPSVRPSWLISYDGPYLSEWAARAAVTCRGTAPADRRRLEELLDRYSVVVAALSSMPATLVHGEFYSSNVLVVCGSGYVRICPVDWETAGVGPGLVDLAALTSGAWAEEERAFISAAYFEASGGAGRWATFEEMLVELDLCRLYIAMQWLGWALDWEPPTRDDSNWMEMAFQTAERLGL